MCAVNGRSELEAGERQAGLRRLDRHMYFWNRIFSAALAASLAVAPAFAQEASAPKGLSVELNELAASPKGCLFTFVAGNSFDQQISKVSFEFVLFNEKGTVERMVVLDFRELPAGKTKVRQFDLPGTRCETVKSLLINDAPVCQGEGIAKDDCMKTIVTRSKSPVELKG